MRTSPGRLPGPVLPGESSVSSVTCAVESAKSFSSLPASARPKSGRGSEAASIREVFETLEALLLKYLPEGEPLYPAVYVTDQPDRFIAG